MRRSGLVVPVAVDPSGARGPTPKQARGPGWRRTSPGLFVPATDGPEPKGDAEIDQRIVEVAAGLPVGAAITGWAALHWQGARYLGADARPRPAIDVALHDHGHLARRAGVQLSCDWLFEADVIDVDGLPVTRPERSVTFMARRARSLEAAVQAIDMACRADLVDLRALARYAAALAARPGVRQLRLAVELADENVWSPMESVMRLRWLDVTRVRPRCNVPIFDLDGRHLLTPDLLDPVLGLAGEYDGRVHEQVGVRRRDLDREELARVHGIEMVSMIAEDRARDPGFTRRLLAARARATARTGSRTWTLAPPPWWTDTSTVEQRRALARRRETA